jgi:Zn-dependent peptidase ImmA (M78 family)
VFVNGAETKAAQMFTLAHELAHVWAGESAVSNAQASDFNPIATERWANFVAAELLVPLAALREVFRPNDIDREILRLAAHFKVSTLVVLRRLFDLEAITREEFWERYHAEVERIRSFTGREATGGNFYSTETLRVGRRFASAVITSTLAGRTSYRNAFRMLGIASTATLENFGRRLGVLG